MHSLFFNTLCFHQNEILKLFRLQLGWDDKVHFNSNVMPSLSRIWARAQWAKVKLGPRRPSHRENKHKFQKYIAGNGKVLSKNVSVD